MLLADIVAFVILLAVTAYGVLAGADFGGGVWDLFAFGPRKKEQRAAISRAMAPVWEANHVWLIFVIVLLFTSFPRAFSLLVTALFVPFHLALVGIVLRGAAFVFRAYAPRGPLGEGTRRYLVDRATPAFGAIFGAASVVTPLLLGMAMGAVSSGRLRVADPEGAARQWTSPLSILTGVLALALTAYTAAVFLAWESERHGERDLSDDFRSRALVSGGVVVALTVLILPITASQSPHITRSLVSLPALPVVAFGGAAALVAGFALLRRHLHLARIATVAQIAALLGGWGLAEYPYLVYPDIKLADVAAPEATLRFVVVSLPFAAMLLVPSLWLLFRIFKGRGVPVGTDSSH